MGMSSLKVDYSDIVTQSLAYSLLDEGQLGMVSLALLYLQNKRRGLSVRKWPDQTGSETHKTLPPCKKGSHLAGLGI